MPSTTKPIGLGSISDQSKKFSGAFFTGDTEVQNNQRHKTGWTGLLTRTTDSLEWVKVECKWNTQEARPMGRPKTVMRMHLLILIGNEMFYFN